MGGGSRGRLIPPPDCVPALWHQHSCMAACCCIPVPMTIHTHLPSPSPPPPPCSLQSGRMRNVTSVRAKACVWGAPTRAFAVASCASTFSRPVPMQAFASWRPKSPALGCRRAQAAPALQDLHQRAASPRCRHAWGSRCSAASSRWHRAQRQGGFLSTRKARRGWQHRRRTASRQRWRGMRELTSQTPWCSWTSGGIIPGCMTAPPRGACVRGWVKGEHPFAGIAQAGSPCGLAAAVLVIHPMPTYPPLYASAKTLTLNPSRPKTQPRLPSTCLQGQGGCAPNRQ